MKLYVDSIQFRGINSNGVKTWCWTNHPVYDLYLFVIFNTAKGEDSNGHRVGDQVTLPKSLPTVDIIQPVQGHQKVQDAAQRAQG